MTSEYTMEFIWIMSGYNPCKRETIEQLINSASIRPYFPNIFTGLTNWLKSFSPLPLCSVDSPNFAFSLHFFMEIMEKSFSLFSFFPTAIAQNLFLNGFLKDFWALFRAIFSNDCPKWKLSNEESNGGFNEISMIFPMVFPMIFSNGFSSNVRVKHS